MLTDGSTENSRAPEMPETDASWSSATARSRNIRSSNRNVVLTAPEICDLSSVEQAMARALDERALSRSRDA
jgi:hypothetical protein